MSSRTHTSHLPQITNFHYLFMGIHKKYCDIARAKEVCITCEWKWERKAFSPSQKASMLTLRLCVLIAHLIAHKFLFHVISVLPKERFSCFFFLFFSLLRLVAHPYIQRGDDSRADMLRFQRESRWTLARGPHLRPDVAVLCRISSSIACVSAWQNIVSTVSSWVHKTSQRKIVFVFEMYLKCLI